MLREYQPDARSECEDDGNCGATHECVRPPSESCQDRYRVRFGSALRDHWLDAALAKSRTMRFGIVAAIGVDDFGLLKWSTTHAANRWNRVNEWQQLGDVVAVRAGQECTDGDSIRVDENVMLGTWSRAIRWVLTRFSPAPTARTDDQSTAAREKSSWPASRSLLAAFARLAEGGRMGPTTRVAARERIRTPGWPGMAFRPECHDALPSLRLRRADSVDVVSCAVVGKRRDDWLAPPKGSPWRIRGCHST